ncbi:MAG TPA: glycosyltransferase family 4 protein [Stenomitos sp.]
MRLFAFTENYARGGGNRYLMDVINGIPGDIDDVVLASNPGGLYPEDLGRLEPAVQALSLPILTSARLQHAFHLPTRALRFGLRLALMPLEPVFFCYNVILFSRLLKQHRPAMVWSASGGYPSARSTLALVVAARWQKVVSILSIVSMPTPRDRWFYPLHRLLDSLVARSVTRIIVNAEAIKQALVTLHDLPAERISVLYNGLPDHASPGRTEPTKRLTLGLISRLDKEKGVLVLFDAFKQLSARHPELTLHLVGKGNASATIADRIEQEGLADKVIAEGYHAGPIEDLLESFDVYVFPSFHEGFPYSLLEAMRAGCAIVASSVGGVPEAIVEGQEGILVPPGEVEALADALEQAITDPELRRTLGQRARARFEQAFVLERMHERLGRVLEECTRGLKP